MSEDEVTLKANKPNALELSDLRDELVREYEFPNGQVYRIEHPRWLYRRPGGTTHRVLDASGMVHCVPFPTVDGGVVVLRWEPRDHNDPVKF